MNSRVSNSKNPRPRQFLALGLAVTCTATALASSSQVAPASAAGAVEPATPKFSEPVDDTPIYRKENECSPTEKPGPQFVRDLINKTYGTASQNIVRPCPPNPRSSHNAGRALDWMRHYSKPDQKKQVDDFVHWLNKSEGGVPHANARRLGMMYIIWNDRKFYYFRGSRAAWEPYYTTASVEEYDEATQKLVPVRKKVACTSTKPEEQAIREAQYDNMCHRNHLHISFTHEGGAAETSFYKAAGFVPKPTPTPTPTPTPKPTPSLGYTPCSSMWPSGSKIPSAPTAALGFVAVEPVRVLDTRSGVGTKSAEKCRMQPKKSLNVKVLGQGGVPASGVAAVVINLTGVKPTAGTYISTYPSGGLLPDTSSVNVGAKQNTAATVTVPVGRDGRIALYSGVADTDAVVDVVGYYSASSGDKFTPMESKRVLDKKLGARRWYSVPARVPSGANAIMANVTGDQPTGPGYLTMHPKQRSGNPKTSSLNMNPKGAVANRALMKVEAGGATLYSNVGSRAIVDVNGWFGKSGATSFYALNPKRIVDTRTSGAGQLGKLYGGKEQTVQVAGKGGIPAGAKAAVLTLTSAAPSTSQYLSMWKGDQSWPGTSDLNTVAGQPQANMVVVPLDASGRAKIKVNRGTSHVILDALGYYK